MEVTIERILPGGLGIGHAEGRTVMVPLSIAGDRLRVEVERVKSTVSFARLVEIITPGPNRVEPPCPYFGRCGGCDFQQLNYQAQLDAKVHILSDCLRRIGGFESIPDFQIVPSPNPWHYRSRAQWQYDSIRKRLGYFESGSRRVCDVSECAVLAPELQQTLERLRLRMHEGSLPDEARDFRAVVGDDDVSVAASVKSRDRNSSPTVREGSRVRGSSPTVREGLDLTLGANEVGEVTRSIHGETYCLNAETFFQTNYDLLPKLIDAAMKDAVGELAIDLYCGVGLFTLPLARRFAHTAGVEADEMAASYARENLANGGLVNAEIANQNVGDWLEEALANNSRDAGFDFSRITAPPGPSRARRNIQVRTAGAAVQREAAAPPRRIDFILLDPPRTGAESRVIAGIIRLKPRRICYVSCDPATLARDLKKLLAGGYAIDTITAFDLFPQTHHVETVVHLSIQPGEQSVPDSHP